MATRLETSVLRCTGISYLENQKRKTDRGKAILVLEFETVCPLHKSHDDEVYRDKQWLKSLVVVFHSVPDRGNSRNHSITFGDFAKIFVGNTMSIWVH